MFSSRSSSFARTCAETPAPKKPQRLEYGSVPHPLPVSRSSPEKYARWVWLLCTYSGDIASRIEQFHTLPEYVSGCGTFTEFPAPEARTLRDCAFLQKTGPGTPSRNPVCRDSAGPCATRGRILPANPAGVRLSSVDECFPSCAGIAPGQDVCNAKPGFCGSRRWGNSCVNQKKCPVIEV